MKIIFMYIQSYGCLQERGFLFDAHYSVVYRKQDNVLHIKIDEKDESLDSILYGNMSITAIVGDNGAGKSTCLDALQSWLVNFKNNPGVVVWEQDKELIYHSYQDNYVCVESVHKQVKQYIRSKAPLPLNAVFFSDVLGDRNESYRIQETSRSISYHINLYKDISTSGLLQEAEVKPEYFPIRGLSARDSLLQIKLIDFFCTDEKNYPWKSIIGRKYLNFQFLNSRYIRYKLNDQGREFEEKDDLLSRIIRWTRHNERRLPDLYFVVRETLFFDYVRKLNNAVVIRNKPGVPHETGIINAIVDTIFQDYAELSDKEVLDRIFDGFNYEQFMERAREVGEKRGFVNLPDFQAYIKLYNRLVQNSWFMNCIDLIQEFNGKSLSRAMNTRDRTISIPIPEGESIQELYQCYMDAHTYEELLKFEWNMSSGENSICLLFARLYETICNANSQDGEIKSYLIMIDEVDCLYHPRWQQKIIFWISRFLNNAFPDYEFQVIITTHSPVLLSDVPVNRVIFMPREYPSKKSRGMRHDETFAANIATLYYDAFFMHEGSIGEVAKNLVDMLYELLATEYEGSSYHVPITTEEQADHNKTVLSKRMAEEFNRRYKKEIDINSDNAIPILLQLIDIVGEDIWRDQLRVLYKRNFVFGNTRNTDKSRIQGILSNYSPEDRNAILKELISDGAHKKETE